MSNKTSASRKGSRLGPFFAARGGLCGRRHTGASEEEPGDSDPRAWELCEATVLSRHFTDATLIHFFFFADSSEASRTRWGM